MVRLEITLNVPAKKPKSMALGNVELTWDNILQFAINKTKVKSKRKKKLSGKKNQNLQLYIVKKSPQPAGTLLTPECEEEGWDKYLVDGTVITLSNGDGYLIGNSEVESKIDIFDTQVPLPPRHPFPTRDNIKREKYIPPPEKIDLDDSPTSWLKLNLKEFEPSLSNAGSVKKLASSLRFKPQMLSGGTLREVKKKKY